jgi:hypothetical protein
LNDRALGCPTLWVGNDERTGNYQLRTIDRRFENAAAARLGSDSGRDDIALRQEMHDPLHALPRPSRNRLGIGNCEDWTEHALCLAPGLADLRDGPGTARLALADHVFDQRKRRHQRDREGDDRHDLENQRVGKAIVKKRHRCGLIGRAGRCGHDWGPHLTGTQLERAFVAESRPKLGHLPAHPRKNWVRGEDNPPSLGEGRSVRLSP